MDHLNWGVLGASKFALEHLTPAMQLSKNNRFLALATRSKQKAAPFVRLEPGIDVFDDYDQLLADNRINAVYIPLPNTMHVDWTKRAIQTGKHVLCEKPMLFDNNEYASILEATLDSGISLLINYVRRYDPQIISVGERIRANEFGKPILAKVWYSGQFV